MNVDVSLAAPPNIVIITGNNIGYGDLLSMCLKAAGLPEPADHVLDARNPLTELRGEAASPHDYPEFEHQAYRAIRQGNDRMIWDKKDKQRHLYDLAEDAGKTKDLIAEEPKKAEALTAVWESWREGTQEF